MPIRFEVHIVPALCFEQCRSKIDYFNRRVPQGVDELIQSRSVRSLTRFPNVLGINGLLQRRHDEEVLNSAGGQPSISSGQRFSPASQLLLRQRRAEVVSVEKPAVLAHNHFG